MTNAKSDPVAALCPVLECGVHCTAISSPTGEALPSESANNSMHTNIATIRESQYLEFGHLDSTSGGALDSESEVMLQY